MTTTLAPGGTGGPGASGAAEAVPRTTVVRRTPEETAAPPQQRRRVGGRRREDSLALYGAAASGLSVATLLFGQLAPLSGKLGFVLVAYTVFLAVYALLVSLADNGPAIRDRLMTVVLGSMATVLFAALFLVVGFTTVKGWGAIWHGNFYTQDMQAAGPLDPITVGGIKHAIAGTLIQIVIALAITVPLGITCAVFLGQIRGGFTRFVRTIVEAMTALPSIVAGLFVYATWILMLHFEKSGLAAGLAISVMMLPIIIRASDVVLRLVPGNLTEAAEAMGAPRWRTVWHVILPTSRSGLATAVILGTARGIGETSPVLLTAGATAGLNTDPLHGPMMSLPLAVFTLIKSPQPAMQERAFGTALVLMALVLVLFATARAIGGRGPGQLSGRQARRAGRASARDLGRFGRSDRPDRPDRSTTWQPGAGPLPAATPTTATATPPGDS